MFGPSLKGWNRRRLVLWLSLFFLAVALPTLILIYQAYTRLKWEAFHHHQVLAAELAGRIDTRFIQIVNVEEGRSFADYGFLVIAGDPAANFLQRSPLSAYPVESDIPGLVGYFQIDAEGLLTSPLLPEDGNLSAYGIPAGEVAQRRGLVRDLERILSRNRLVGGREPPAPSRPGESAQVRENDLSQFGATRQSRKDKDRAGSTVFSQEASTDGAQERAVPAQAAFDQLNEAVEREGKKQEAAGSLGRVEDLKLVAPYRSAEGVNVPSPLVAKKAPFQEKRSARKERSALPERYAAGLADTLQDEEMFRRNIRVSTFESEIDPFEFSLLDSGHFVLFRKVWRDGRRYIQGALVEQQPFLRGVVESIFGETALSLMSDLVVAYRGDVLSLFSARSARSYLSEAGELRGALLYRSRLSPPLVDLELIFSVKRLPAGPGARVVSWAALSVALVLLTGFYLMYRLGAGQIDLTRQQQDFVSAVSHELKTPLTSIRMYSEILLEGWAGEDKKKTYYAYIHDESERLSRLIANVLQLARMTRNDLRPDLRPVVVDELMAATVSRIASQVESTGFGLELEVAPDVGEELVELDRDFFTQTVINLVDNAIKFSARAEHRRVVLSCERLRDGTVQFAVRDFGPGVPRDQMKKIFQLFYRSRNELTRETVGTGIGLALVHQLTLAMGGRVDVVNRDPGAEFRIRFRPARRTPP